MRAAIALIALALGALAGAIYVLDGAASGIVPLVIGLSAGVLGVSLARLTGAAGGRSSRSDGASRGPLGRDLRETVQFTSASQILVLWGALAILFYGVFWALVGPSAPNFFGLLSFLALGVLLFVVLFILSWPMLAAHPRGLVRVMWVALAMVYVGGLVFTYQELAIQLPGYLSKKQLAQVRAHGGTPIYTDEADDGIAWPSPLPSDSQVIVLDAESRNPSHGGTLAERAVDAVVTVRFYRGHGSAFVISKDGLAITNHHVARRGPPLRVRFRDGRERPARVVRSVAGPDVALIQIPCDSTCVTMDLTLPIEAQLGEEILVLGTPKTLDLHGTITRGIVSGVREDHGVGIIQTDAAVNFGNSGGPMIDAQSGQVLGVVTSSVTDRGAQGLHFGVAIDDAIEALGVRIAY